MKLSILMTGKAYLPEAYAYEDFLTKRGWVVKLCEPGAPDYDCDVLITFQPERMPRRGGLRCKVVHEYHSLPTGKYPGLRRTVKKLLTAKPDGRIFLNDTVRDHLGFRDGIASINRDMGVDDRFYERASVEQEFDVVYCGSVTGRTGLTGVINGLCEAGLRILVVGAAPQNFADSLVKPDQVEILGRIERSGVPRQIRRARFGLNYTPDIYPLNIQTSTKTLEYLAAGLGVISNRYEWSEWFASQDGIHLTWLDDVLASGKLPELETAPDMDAYRWTNILSRGGFEDFLRSLK